MQMTTSLFGGSASLQIIDHVLLMINWLQGIFKKLRGEGSDSRSEVPSIIKHRDVNQSGSNSSVDEMKVEYKL